MGDLSLDQSSQVVAEEDWEESVHMLGHFLGLCGSHGTSSGPVSQKGAGLGEHFGSLLHLCMHHAPS